ncbi:Uu.00g070100.m01.CDS01 [Anthostomella pinea]|uniref:Protein-S-isoprenylcysteine O-methyltransferase n=1 Tax=Anthostomella pinea TaxID=933095 RepID=A0AAI8VVG6_9PEZI|nr:Uu.00g070100.m01.CDS01 [Anthostomella pinea]
MPLPAISLAQGSLAATILLAAVGTYIGATPPNPDAEATHTIPASGDTVRSLLITNKRSIRLTLMAPLGLFSLHTVTLALLHPNIPPSILGYGAQNGLNPDRITWSAATAVPLALILCAGVPLRMVAYASLGTNFTFALKEPDRLTTTGIYRYVQHPSYTGLVILVISNVALLGRMDGAISCIVPPGWRDDLAALQWAVFPGFLFMVWKRTMQEESMMRARFGAEWEGWHARTARYIPWVF